MDYPAPFLALTVGDPCGIGPEITVKALSSLPEPFRSRLIVVGPGLALKNTARDLGIVTLLWCPWDHPTLGNIRLIDTGGKQSFRAGTVCKEGGKASIHALEEAHKLCRAGVCAGMVTGPIGKMAIHLAGSPFSGHTDMLAAFCGVKATRMAMVHGRFRVVMTTLHVPYRDVPRLLTPASVFETLRLAHQAFRSARKPFPHIAVAGLNPHAGEDGLFGIEEREAISPAIAKFRGLNPNVHGPFPADSLYKSEMRKTMDVFVAHTHDQGLIAIKTLGKLNCVNVTLGLPYVRTSVGHGTAYDIAGQGVADERGLLAAIKIGFQLTKTRLKKKS